TPDFVCVSDADGDCSFVVPIGTGAGQVAQGTRLWMATISGPAGYFVNKYWQTAPLTGGTSVNNRLVWPTPPLVGGQTYRSGASWVTDPALTAPAGSPEASQSEYTRRVASGGMVGLSRDNPPLRSGCGLTVALVADMSSSMTVTSVQSLKGAMDTFIDALRGTPSQVALFTLGTDSPAAGFPPNTGLQSVATTADANKVKAQYANPAWPDATPTNYTNWDRGLAAVASANNVIGPVDHFDLVVLITDGNPTVFGPSPVITGGTGYTRFRELENARYSANLLKSQGSRVVAMGVGAGVSSAGAGYNLQTVSGLTPYDSVTGNITTADYIQTENFSTVGNALRDLVIHGCAPSISIAKRIVPFGGTVADAYTPGDQWTFTSGSLSAPATITPASALTDLQTGAVAFDVNLNGQDPATFWLDETVIGGYSIYQVDADGAEAGARSYNAYCVDKGTGTDVPVPVVNTADGFQVPVTGQSVMSCIIYNEAPDFDAASVVVNKRWRVISDAGTDDYYNGAQPSSLRAQLSMDGPAGAAVSHQEWGQERSGYDITVDSHITLSENVITVTLPECALTGSTIADGGPDDTAWASGAAFAAAGQDMTLTSGRNEWTITNIIECHSYLTLEKDVAFGPASPTAWTLEAIAPQGALAGPSGRDGEAAVTKVEVTHGVAYQLAETPDASPEYLSHYVQDDVRTQPLTYPLSSGSWSCYVDGVVGPRMIFGDDGGVIVALGQHVICTARNSVSMLTVVKTVEGGTASPTDFSYDVVPVGTILPGAHTHTVTISAPPVIASMLIRPFQHYKIVENGPAGYQVAESATACTSAGQVLDRNDFMLLPGGNITCMFTNTATSTLGVLKVDAETDEPLSGAVFDLALDDGDGIWDAATDQVVASCTTDTAGTCTVSDLDFGTYFWLERTAPPGYTAPGPPVGGPITIDASNAGGIVEITTVRNSEVLTSLSLIKVDIPGGTPLAGAQFQLYRSASGDEPGDGPEAADTPVGPVCTTPASGLCTVDDLPFGSYFWYEVAAPPGHVLPTNRTTPLITLNASNAGSTIPAHYFSDPRLPGTLEVRKVDEADRSLLPGGIFNLYLDDGNGAWDTADLLIGQCTTGASGTCRLAHLDFGTYFWVEVGAPIGYDLPADPVSDPLVITAGNVDQIQQFTFADTRSPGSLVVTKVVDGDGAATWGAGPFEVTLECTDVDSHALAVPGGATRTLAEANSYTAVYEPLEPGSTCTLTETGTSGATSTVITDGSGNPGDTFVVGAGDRFELVVTNTFDLGSITVVKALSGGTASAHSDDLFGVHLDCWYQGDVIAIPGGADRTISVTITALYEDLPVGAMCTLAETDPGEAAAVTYVPADVLNPAQARVTVEPGATVTIRVDNRFDYTPPPEPPPGPPNPPDRPGPPPGPSGPPLIKTGADLAPLVALAVLFVAAGAVVLRLRTRAGTVAQ
ncbi:MAG: SpaA isopeptide-forming pilin-related protein, partial [Micrococcales bacterium]|nr:SpaA isopeptide-forming pilin-related protein [Micrococcales bacterium]